MFINLQAFGFFIVDYKDLEPKNKTKNILIT